MDFGRIHVSRSQIRLLIPDGGPGNADDGLHVADKDVAPSEEAEQFAVTPQVAPVILPGASGFNDEFSHFLKSRNWES